MIHGNEAKKSSQAIPPPRHRHSAVIYDEGMWVYGGMTDLQERSDLWRLDLGKRCLNTSDTVTDLLIVCSTPRQSASSGASSGANSDPVHFTVTAPSVCTRLCC
jgi:Kelch motif